MTKAAAMIRRVGAFIFGKKPAAFPPARADLPPRLARTPLEELLLADEIEPGAPSIRPHEYAPWHGGRAYRH